VIITGNNNSTAVAIY